MITEEIKISITDIFPEITNINDPDLKLGVKTNILINFSEISNQH